jgi:hypothetical protein
VLCKGLPEGGQHDGAGDPVVGRDREGVAGAVIEPGQDLGVGAGTAIGLGEPVVGEVALPGFVGHRSLEPDVGRLGLLLRLRNHQPGLGQVPRDRRSRHGDAVVVGQVPPDGVGAGVQAGRGQFLPVLEDQVDGLDRDRGACGPGSPGAGLKGGVTLGLVAGEQLEEPGLGDAVLGGDIADGTVLDHHGGDQQSVECHAPDAGGASGRIPG